MTNFSNFSSLLQLGVGLGIGLGVFQAPIEIRRAKISSTLTSRLLLTDKSEDPRIIDSNISLRDAKYDFEVACHSLEDKAKLPFVTALLFSSIDIVLLIWCSLMPNIEVNYCNSAGIVFSSVIVYVAIIGYMDIQARHYYSPIVDKISAIN